jgi:hypothetical protein
MGTLFLLACTSRKPARDSAVDVRRSVVDVEAPPEPPREPPKGVWRSTVLTTDAISNALYGNGDVVLGVAAKPAADLGHAEMRWLRWSPGGVSVLATRTVTGTFPAAPMALLRRASGYTIVWPAALIDGGTNPRAIDIEDNNFSSDERTATASEISAARWMSESVSPRRLSGASNFPPPFDSGRVHLRVEVRRSRPTPTVMLGEMEITQGWDLPGIEPSLGYVAEGDTQWIAVSRGHCQQARIEVFMVRDDKVTLRGRHLLGTELAVRWIRMDPQPGHVLVTWYQGLIPFRIPCIRASNGATLADHGVRLAVTTVNGEEPPAVPELPDAGVLAEDVLDAGGDVVPGTIDANSDVSGQ